MSAARDIPAAIAGEMGALLAEAGATGRAQWLRCGRVMIPIRPWLYDTANLEAALAFLMLMARQRLTETLGRVPEPHDYFPSGAAYLQSAAPSAGGADGGGPRPSRAAFNGAGIPAGPPAPHGAGGNILPFRGR